MRAKIAIFGGTTEGRELAEWLAGNGVSTLLFAAAAYGGEPVPERQNLAVNTERLDQTGIETALLWHGCRLVLDATHPYDEAAANVRAACEKLELEYVRVIREELVDEGVIPADSAAHAAEILDKSDEKALLTVGSKELAEFRMVRDFKKRLYARVLPSSEVLFKCEALGFSGAQIISMQGPFTREMNVATIRMLGVKLLVTKDSGNLGGVIEKLEACRDTGVKMILIRRPVSRDDGMTVREAMEFLRGRFSLPEDIPAEPAPETLPDVPQPDKPADIAEPAGNPENRRFPLFVKLAGTPAAVVGGGAAATARVKTLLQFGADIRVISPGVTQELLALAADGKITWIKSEYAPAFLGNALIVVAATNDRAVNEAAGFDAKRRQLFVSVDDSRTEGNFFFPAVALSDGLVAGIVSENNDHAAVARAAEKLRRALRDSERMNAE